MTPVGVSFGWANHSFCVYVKHLYRCSSFFRKTTGFPLCIESNALEKFTNSSLASRFFARTSLMIRGIVRISEFVEQFLRKSFWFFKNFFLNFGLGKIEKKGTINLCKLATINISKLTFGDHKYIQTYIYLHLLEGSLFDSYWPRCRGTLLLSLCCSTLPLILTL